MSPRKEKKKPNKPAAAPVEAGPLAHNPFATLKGLKIEAPKPAAPEPAPAPIPSLRQDDEQGYFEAAMAEVTPLDWKNRPVPGTPRPREAAAEVYSEDLDVLTHLGDLVSGRAQFDIVDTDEYLEGFVRGTHPLILEKLRRGLFSVQAYLDLHGLTVREAEEEVRDFIVEAMTLGYRCVLLVHGRGLNSKDQIPVLKKRLETILLRGPTRKQILAFTSARPHDGGAGASYVLLRAKKPATRPRSG
jgi:DNA-nicking Smr family endonuclease